jgi:transglutaminase-like putative cysteine protease
MNYTVSHKTSYTYLEPVSLCHNIVKLLPRSANGQISTNESIKISPEPDRIDVYEDFFGNRVFYFSIEKEHRQLIVNVTTAIEKAVMGEEKINSAITAEEVRQVLNEPGPENNDIRQYVFETPMTAWNAEIEAYAHKSFLSGRPVVEAAKELMYRIYTDFEFKPGITTIATPLVKVMQQRKGVCQDFAHFAIACARSAGLPARYVSGYIETIPPPGAEKLVGADASHAWFSLYVPGAGWIDFDPTNNMMPAAQHITIGWGRDYADIAPFKGIIIGSGSHELSVSVDVRREN